MYVLKIQMFRRVPKDCNEASSAKQAKPSERGNKSKPDDKVDDPSKCTSKSGMGKTPYVKKL